MSSRTNVRRALVGVVAAVVMVVSAGAAQADNERGGRYSGNNADGSQVSIRPNSYSVGTSSNCWITSTLAKGESGPGNQIQVGAVRCGTGSPGLDGNSACKAHKFFETIVNGVYNCIGKGAVSVGVYHDYQVNRSSSGSSTYYSYIDGAYAGSNSNIFSGSTRHWVWDEWSNVNTGCPGANINATFKNWRKYDFSSGWTVTDGQGIYNAPSTCFSVTGVNSQREFNVNR